MKENGTIMLLKDLEFTLTTIMLSMKANGMPIYKMVKAQKNGQMDQSSSDNTKTVKRTVQVNITGLMGPDTKENGSTMTCAGMDITSGLTGGNSSVSGKATL